MPTSKLLTRNDLQNVLAHINLGDDAHMELTQAEFDQLSEEDKNNGTIYFVTDGASGKVFLDDNTPIGTIASYGGSSDPTYWLICDGRAVSRTAYAELFAVIGTTYGSGDGSTTFNIPDLRGRVSLGTASGYAMGSTGGNKDAIIPYHTHTLSRTTNVAVAAHGITQPTFNVSGGLFWKTWGDSTIVNSSYAATTTSSSGSHFYNASNTATRTTNVALTNNHSVTQPEFSASYAGTNGNLTNANLQPYVVTNYIIKAYSTISEHQATIDAFYPVGSYYETSDTTFDPNISWGGTWTSETITNDEIITGTPTITGANSGVYCNLSRMGKMVRFQFGVNFNLNLDAGTSTIVGSIPLGFRPTAEVTVGGYILGGTYGFAYLEPNGEIKLQRVNAGTGNLIRQNFVYFTSDDVSTGLRWHRTA